MNFEGPPRGESRLNFLRINMVGHGIKIDEDRFSAEPCHDACCRKESEGGSKNIVARLNFYSHKRSEKSVLTRRYSSSLIRIRVDL